MHEWLGDGTGLVQKEGHPEIETCFLSMFDAGTAFTRSHHRMNIGARPSLISLKKCVMACAANVF